MATLGIGLIAFSLHGAGTAVQAGTPAGRPAYVASRPTSATGSLPAHAEQITIRIESQQAPVGVIAGDTVDVIADDPVSGSPVVVAPHVEVAAVGSSDGNGASVTLDCPHDVAIAIAGVQLASKPMTLLRTTASN